MSIPTVPSENYENTPLNKFKLLILSPEVTDTEIEVVFMEFSIENEEELIEVCNLLREHRSALYNSLGIREKFSRKENLN